MPAPGEQIEHPDGVGLALGLAEDLPVDHHDGVGGNDDILLRAVLRNGSRLFRADPRDLLLRRQRRIHMLVDVRRMYGKFQPQKLQKLLPPGRFGC